MIMAFDPASAYVLLLVVAGIPLLLAFGGVLLLRSDTALQHGEFGPERDRPGTDQPSPRRLNSRT